MSTANDTPVQVHEIEVIECECEAGCDRLIWVCSCGERTAQGEGWLDEDEAERAGEAHRAAHQPLHTAERPVPGCACYGCQPIDMRHWRGPSILRSDAPDDYGQGFHDGMRAEAERQQRLREQGL
jgi:hypothetical protein